MGSQRVRHDWATDLIWSESTPNRLNLKRITLRHIIIKSSKDKDRILKTASKKPLVTHKRASPFSTPVVLSADFFAGQEEEIWSIQNTKKRILSTKRYDLFKILKKEYCQPGKTVLKNR